MKNSSRQSLVLSGVFCVLLLSACSGQSGGQAEAADAEKEDKKEQIAVPVEIAEVSKGDIAAVYTNTTSLESEEEATVVAKVSEIITEIFVEEGDRVKKGQVLLQLNTDKLTLEVKRAEANLSRMKSELDRNHRIYKKKMVSSDTYERLKFEYDAQKAAFELAKLELEYATVRAPISGVVSQRMVKVGNMVRPNDPVFQISDFDPLIAVIHVPERELYKLQERQTAVLQVDALNGREFTGHIERISPIVDSNSGTFKVTVEIADPENNLKPGMFGRIGIIYASHKDSLLIDKNALIAEADSPQVYLIKDDKAVVREIKTGFIDNLHIEVLSGLNVGDHVVVAGKNSLKNDSKVEVLNSDVVTEEIPSDGDTSVASSEVRNTANN